MWALVAGIATRIATPAATSPATLEMANELRILILEDEAAAADLLEWELRRSKIPFTARRVATKEDYVRGLEDFAPDVILSDYTLPNFDGMEALSLAQARVPHVPVIIVTGYAAVSLPARNVEAILEKPVSKQRLLENLRPIIARRMGR